MRARWLRLSVPGLALLLTLGMASPAVAEPNPTPNYVWVSGTTMIYEAGLSTRNELVLTQIAAFQVTFTDTSAIATGAGCVQGATNREATCTVATNFAWGLDLYLGSKDDTLTFTGGKFNDSHVYVDAGAGNDTVSFGAYSSKFTGRVDGGPGNDTLTGPATTAELRLDGQGGADILCGGLGSAAYYGDRTAPVTVSLNAIANDGESGEGDLVCSTIHRVIGGQGNDTIFGSNGENWLYGQGGNDQLYGGSGDDYLNAGTGVNSLDGGLGYEDRCIGSRLDAITNCEL